MTRGGAIARILAPGTRTQPPKRDRQTGPETATTTARIDALCERVRELARAAGEEALAAKRRQARTLVDESTAQVKAECQARLQRARTQLRSRVQQRSQASQLAARAKLANQCWTELTAVLDEAERRVEQLRRDEPQHYAASLVGFFHAAAAQLGEGALVVRANPQDVSLLRDRLHTTRRQIDIVEDEIRAGIVVTTADGNIACDHSIARRRQRQEHAMRLAATEILFPDAQRGQPAPETTDE